MDAATSTPRLSLPSLFSFVAFIPGRGLRAFAATVTTSDPETAEVGDLWMDAGEVAMRKGENGVLTREEDQAASEAAVEVLGWLSEGCSLEEATARSIQAAGASEERWEARGMEAHAEDFGGPAWHPYC